MTKLSPAAQAVWDAYNDVCERVGVFEDYGDALAAVFRAAADQLFPGPNDWDKDNMSQQGLWLLRLKRDQLLAIAAELRGTNPTNQED